VGGGGGWIIPTWGFLGPGPFFFLCVGGVVWGGGVGVGGGGLGGGGGGGGGGV